MHFSGETTSPTVFHLVDFGVDKIIGHPMVAEYVNRLGQNTLVRNSDAKVP